jgi:hypothetical protein
MSKGDSVEQRPDVVSLADEEGVKQILTDSPRTHLSQTRRIWTYPGVWPERMKRSP